MRRFYPLVGTAIALLFATPAIQAQLASLSVTPDVVRLDGPESSLQVLVANVWPNGFPQDCTSDVSYRILDPAIASVDDRGLLQPRAEGTTTLVIASGKDEQKIPVVVTGILDPVPIAFRNEVIPVLTKSGCNSAGCHGKAEGQNGFKLSIFGFDAETDHRALTMEGRGRRVMTEAPEQSLLLRKGAGRMPHGGARAIEKNSYAYRRLRRWIQEGARLESEAASPITSIRVEPTERTLNLKGRQQLRVVATDAAGHTRDVTAEAAYETNAPSITEIDERGLIQGADIPGEAAILVRYLGHVAVSRISIPRPGITFERPPENNFIDGLVWDKLREMGIRPSGPCDDATFLRRVHLDTIGTLPTAEEARAFLDSDDPKKRARLITKLLDRPEYATYWALRWADLLRTDANALGPESAYSMSRWLRLQFERNRPYDQMVRDILTARGSTQAIGAAPMYLTLNQPKELAGATSQLFLGVRIECAECHHHPFERWSQQDFTAYAGFFTGLKQKTLPSGVKSIVAGGGSDLKHPRTGEVVPAAGLGQVTTTPIEEDTDRRQPLAEWMTAKDNPFFARALANRLWAHYFGRGLVDPVDDMRASNPATNEPLLDALAEHLQNVDCDLKEFTKAILNSRVYQASTETDETNAQDRQQFSHMDYRPMPAEVLLDAICDATNVSEKFNGWPIGARAIEVWDNRMPSYFFRVFGRPGRTTVCACERGDDPSITQALHLMNAPEIDAKIRHRKGRARELAESKLSPDEIITNLYLTTLSRRPNEAELQLMLRAFDGERRAAVEDVLWTLLNTKEFLFNH